MAKDDVIITIRGNDQVSKKLDQIFNNLNNKSNKTSRNVTNGFASMSRAASSFGIILGTAGIALAFKNIIDTAVEFESAFTGVRKTVDATELEFKQLSNGIREMSKRIPVAAKDLAKIQEIAGQLGVKGVKNLSKFTENIAKIAVSTNLTKEAAATNFARIASVMEEPLENIDRMASAVVELGNNAATNEAEILTFAQRIASAGKIAVLTSADVFGIATAFASVGIQAEAGGSAVRKILLDLNSQGKRGAESFQNFIDTLEKSGTNASKVLEQLGFSEARVQNAFLSVAGARGKLNEELERSNKGYKENISLNREAAIRFGTTASQIQLFKNNIADLSIGMGEVFIPVLNETFSALIVLANGLKKMGLGYKVLKLAIVDTSIAFTKLRTFFRDPTISKTLLSELEKMRAGIIKLRDERIESNTIQLGELDKLIAKAKELRDIENKAGPVDDPGGGIDAIPESDIVFKAQEQIEQLRELWGAWSDEKTGMELAGMQAQADKFQFMIDTQMQASKTLWSIAGKQRDTFTNGLSQMSKNWLDGNLNIKKSIVEIGKSMVQVLIDFAIRKAVNAALSKTIIATQTAASVTAASVVGAAWAPAAAMVSLASFGANSAPAQAGMTSTVGLAHMLAIPALENGGIIPGSPKGTLIRAGENNKSEAVVPLTGDALGGITVNIFDPVIRNDDDIDILVERLGFEVERNSNRPRMAA